MCKTFFIARHFFNILPLDSFGGNSFLDCTNIRINLRLACLLFVFHAVRRAAMAMAAAMAVVVVRHNKM